MLSSLEILGRFATDVYGFPGAGIDSLLKRSHTNRLVDQFVPRYLLVFNRALVGIFVILSSRHFISIKK